VRPTRQSHRGRAGGWEGRLQATRPVGWFCGGLLRGRGVG